MAPSRAFAIAAIVGALTAQARAVDLEHTRNRHLVSPRLVSKTAVALGVSRPLRPRRATRVVSVPDLHWAAIAGDLDAVQRLLAAGSSLTATETLWGGERALHWGAYGGHPGVVRALIAAGASLETRDDDGETALREALRTDGSGFLTLQALLVAGASPEARSRHDSTALHEAASLLNKHAPVAVHLLRMFGADPNVTMGDSDITPLHLAALQPFDRFGGWPLIDSTIDPNGRAADVNATDRDGRTPLHWVVMGPGSAQDLQVVVWLIDRGVDVNITDDSGSTALDYAVAIGEGTKDLADMLRIVTATTQPGAQ